MAFKFVSLPVLALTGILLIGGEGARADSQNYLRGYIDALLDTRFPSLGLNVRTITSQGVTVITSRVCLGPSQMREIDRILRDTGKISRIVWDPFTDCAAVNAGGAAPAFQNGTEGDESIEIRALPEEELFAPLLADPRQPRFSVSYQRYTTPRQRFSAANVALGEYFGIASGFLGRSGSSQVGIQGGVFALFNLDTPSSDLVNADYWLGFPVSYRKGPWSFLARIYHQSSHLGDEFILGNPGVNRVNLSVEDLEVMMSYEWLQWRLYGGGSYLLNSTPSLARKRLHGGSEFIMPRAAGRLDFVAAADIQASEELDWKRSVSLQVGFEFRSRAQRRRARLMLEYFQGHSPNGQFFRERLRYAGLGLYFGF